MTTIEIIDDRVRFAELRSEWNQLLGSSRSDGLFLTWEWLHTWWTHLGDGRRLFVIAVRSDSRLIALAPLTMSRTWPRTLEFLGSGSIGSDYLDFIADSAHETIAVEAIAECLAASPFTLRLRAVRPDSIVASVMSTTLKASGWRARSATWQVCPFIRLASLSWDSYLQTLGSSHRYNFRRRLRNLEKSFAVRFEPAQSEQECDTALRHVVDLHLRRWTTRGGSDGFHEDRLLSFHREFIAIARDNGWLRLRVLTLNGQPAAAFYGFRYRDKYCFYQSGFDSSFERQSVGLVMIGLTIKEAIEEGAAEYDFLHGDESYKFLWTSEARPLLRVELYPPGVLGRMHRDTAVAVATTKNIVKRALNAAVDR